MTQSTFGPPVVAGLGTALPEHGMTQDEAVELAQQICCRTDAERSLIRVLYRRSGVRQRYTTLPHKIAFDFLDQPIAAAAGQAGLEQDATELDDGRPALGQSLAAEQADASEFALERETCARAVRQPANGWSFTVPARRPWPCGRRPARWPMPGASPRRLLTW